MRASRAAAGVPSTSNERGLATRRRVARTLASLLLVIAGLLPSSGAAAQPEPGPAPERLSPEQRFRRGQNLFEFGDCKGASESLAPLSTGGQLEEEGQQLEVHRILGVCALQLGKAAEAER